MLRSTKVSGGGGGGENAKKTLGLVKLGLASATHIGRLTPDSGLVAVHRTPFNVCTVLHNPQPQKKNLLSLRMPRLPSALCFSGACSEAA
eukprot:scaffold28606_cov118-Isochrysis_galbana.AAC.5